MTETFDADWLSLREDHDHAARHRGLAEALSDALPERPRLLDLGAGTGSLFRWLAPILGRAQAWTLVDADLGLIQRAFAETEAWAARKGWTSSWPSRQVLLVHTPSGAWRMEGLITDLREAPGNLPLDRADAVVNTALCDLVSRAWVERMAAGLAVHRLPFYAALNVSGHERFFPPHPADGLVARGFRRDQARDKGFGGVALGPEAPGAMARAFQAAGYSVRRAPSDWRIGRNASEFASAVASGHAAAARAKLPRHARAVADWLATRERQGRRHVLSARIGHTDLLALPPG
jgi:hypothetical protein